MSAASFAASSRLPLPVPTQLRRPPVQVPPMSGTADAATLRAAAAGATYNTPTTPDAKALRTRAAPPTNGSSTHGTTAPPPAAADLGLLRLDAPVPASTVRKPRRLQLRPTPPGADGGSPAGARVGGLRPPVEDLLAAIVPHRVVGGIAVTTDGAVASDVGADAAAAALLHRGAASQQQTQPLVQCVSATPATRADVIRLQERLDKLLVERQAREVGLCSVRHEIFAQTFDELIRQETLSMPERGLALLRVRDHLRLTIEAYRSLYEAGVTYAHRNSALHTHPVVPGAASIVTGGGGSQAAAASPRAPPSVGAALGGCVPPSLLRHLEELQEQRRKLELHTLELQARCEKVEADAAQQRRVDEAAHAETINFYRRTNHQLAAQLKAETDRANARK